MVGGPSHIDMFHLKPRSNATMDSLCRRATEPSLNHQGRYAASPESLEVPEVRDSAAARSRRYSRTLRNALTIFASCARSTPRAPFIPAMYQANTGRILPGHLGLWITYGLAAKARTCGYVVMPQPEGTPEGGTPCGRALGFCPRCTRGRCFPFGAT